MRIEAHNKLGQPVNIEVTRVVVYDDNDHPISVAVKHDNNWIYVGHLRDREFFDFISSLGIDKTYVVEVINADDIPKLKVS